MTKERKIVLAEFFGNFAVAWLASGIIIPILTNDFSENSILNIVITLIWVSGLLTLVLYLTKKK